MRDRIGFKSLGQPSKLPTYQIPTEKHYIGYVALVLSGKVRTILHRRISNHKITPEGCVCVCIHPYMYTGYIYGDMCICVCMRRGA